jgi:hypothetical protein
VLAALAVQRELKGDRVTGPQAGFGLAVHARCRIVAGDDREPGQILADLWGSVSYDAGWQADRERIEPKPRWRALPRGWRPPGARSREQRLDITAGPFAAGDIIDQLRISGSADVVEVRRPRADLGLQDPTFGDRRNRRWGMCNSRV